MKFIMCILVVSFAVSSCTKSIVNRSEVEVPMVSKFSEKELSFNVQKLRGTLTVEATRTAVDKSEEYSVEFSFDDEGGVVGNIAFQPGQRTITFNLSKVKPSATTVTSISTMKWSDEPVPEEISETTR
ncbi:MAG: hypothetical protein EOP04_14380 [Proteobacteria bacterium]|nr:MAG: hypothetical protein EOP04_14380 [Pseudomonadota bacterium]